MWSKSHRELNSAHTLREKERGRERVSECPHKQTRRDEQEKEGLFKTKAVNMLEAERDRATQRSRKGFLLSQSVRMMRNPPSFSSSACSVMYCLFTCSTDAFCLSRVKPQAQKSSGALLPALIGHSTPSPAPRPCPRVMEAAAARRRRRKGDTYN